MARSDDSASRRRLILVIAIGVVIIAGVVGATLVKRATETVRSTEALCRQLEQSQNLDSALTSLDPATLAPQARAFAEANDVAPKEIAAEVATVSEFVTAVLHEVDAAAPADRRRAFADAIENRQSQIDSVSTAGRALERWASDRCGLTLGDAPVASVP